MDPRHTESSLAREPLPITVRSIGASETYALRHAVLWPTKPLSYVQLPDDIAGQHFGAFLPAGRGTTITTTDSDVSRRHNDDDDDDDDKASNDKQGAANEAEEELLVSIISLFIDSQRGEARFRKFATAPAWQGRGVGSRLLEHTISAAASQGATSIWCDARASALGFYQRFGLHGEGDVFYKGDVPYLRMSRALPLNIG
ncbi:hypothetical protein M426DRAFT_6736 [Hypoxylon sp. CI-4A]|nr:hypothetical protein M426DRAFT_6736 [Hypoxylon sp. CI-4A]